MHEETGTCTVKPSKTQAGEFCKVADDLCWTLNRDTARLRENPSQDGRIMIDRTCVDYLLKQRALIRIWPT